MCNVPNCVVIDHTQTLRQDIFSMSFCEVCEAFCEIRADSLSQTMKLSWIISSVVKFINYLTLLMQLRIK